MSSAEWWQRIVSAPEVKGRPKPAHKDHYAKHAQIKKKKKAEESAERKEKAAARRAAEAQQTQRSRREAVLEFLLEARKGLLDAGSPDPPGGRSHYTGRDLLTLETRLAELLLEHPNRLYGVAVGRGSIASTARACGAMWDGEKNSEEKKAWEKATTVAPTAFAFASTTVAVKETKVIVRPPTECWYSERWAVTLKLMQSLVWRPDGIFKRGGAATDDRDDEPCAWAVRMATLLDEEHEQRSRSGGWLSAAKGSAKGSVKGSAASTAASANGADGGADGGAVERRLVDEFLDALEPHRRELHAKDLAAGEGGDLTVVDLTELTVAIVDGIREPGLLPSREESPITRLRDGLRSGALSQANLVAVTRRVADGAMDMAEARAEIVGLAIDASRGRLGFAERYERGDYEGQIVTTIRDI